MERPRSVKPAQSVAAERASEGNGGNYFSRPKLNLEFFSSGCKTLDLALGGGWAERRIGNVVGDRSSGKTLIMIEAAVHFVRKYRKKGGRVLYREAESAFDLGYAEALGMPLDAVEFGDKPIETVEDMFEDLQEVCKRKEPILYILDSLDALSDRAEMEREIDAATYGATKARMMSQLFRRTTSQMASANVTMLIVSQVRDNIGATFGDGSKRSGGRALDFYASQVIKLAQLSTRKRTIRGIDLPTGIEVRARVTKNKISTPGRESVFDLLFGFGIDDLSASVYYLKTTGALDGVDVPIVNGKPSISRYLQRTMALSDVDYWAEVNRMRDLVERVWYEIERRVMPPRSKYSVRNEVDYDT